MTLFEQACRTTQGARAYQEDFAVAWPGATPFAPARSGAPGEGRLLAILADGMGGHAGGALASRTICQVFLASFAEAVGGPADTALLHALEAANGAVRGEVDADPALEGMGATLVALLAGRDGLEWISVGDSPLLLVRGEECILLNEDHSMAPVLDELARRGEMSATEAAEDHRRHMLLSAVTGEEIELLDLRREPYPLEAGDIVILASDGIQTLLPEEIVRIARAWAGDGVGAIADALIRAVENARVPHQDNTTVLVARALPAAATASA